MHLNCFLLATIKKQVTACIKVSHDDKFGDHLACQKGIMSNTQLFQPQSAGTDDSGNDNVVVRISL